MTQMMDFVSGAIMMSFLVAGFFFRRYWVVTRDRLFLIFACAFWILSLERWVLEATGPTYEFRPYIYLLRLLAFALILVAIIDKNRSQSSTNDGK
jgi:hypothetical protein